MSNTNDPESLNERRRLHRQDVLLSLGLLILVGALIAYAVWELRGSIESRRPASMQKGRE